MTESNNPLEYEIRNAFLDVSAPAALKQRLLTRIREEASAGKPLLSDAVSESLGEIDADRDSVGEGVAQQQVVSLDKTASREEISGTRLGRRFWLAAAAATVGLVAVGWFIIPPSQLSRQEVALRGIQLADDLQGGLAGDKWESNAQWPFAKQLKVHSILGYTRVPDEYFGGKTQQCDVWRVSAPDNQSDFFVVRVAQVDVTAEIIGVLRTIQSSGGWSVAAMQSGNSLVLVVGRGDVKDLIRSSHGQFT